MYRERKSVTPAKTVTHSESCIKENARCSIAKQTHRANPKGQGNYNSPAPHCNLHEIMCKAWKLFRKGIGTFAECLHRAWNSAKAEPINAQRIAEAQQTAGIEEECRTWADWKKQGREVLHGARAAFQVLLIYASKGDGQTYKASFFPASATQPLNA